MARFRKWIEKEIGGIEFDILDSNYVVSERERIFSEYRQGITREQYLEEYSKLKYFDAYTSENEFFKPLNDELTDFERRVNDVNDKVFYDFYYDNEITNSENIEKTIDRLCGFLRDGLSEDSYYALTSRVRDYFNKNRSIIRDHELERILYDEEKSTVDPFPLEGSDKVNYFAGRISATIAIATGNGFREAINFFLECSPEVFCTDRSTGVYFGKGSSYEYIVNDMLLRGRGSMPRLLGLDFLPINDSVLGKLVSLTNEYFNEKNYEEALVGFKELTDSGDKTVKNHAAIMYANCLSRMVRPNNCLHFRIEKNDRVIDCLSLANGNYPKLLLKGLRGEA